MKSTEWHELSAQTKEMASLPINKNNNSSGLELSLWGQIAKRNNG